VRWVAAWSRRISVSKKDIFKEGIRILNKTKRTLNGNMKVSAEDLEVASRD
jgi:hypothetical protein